MLCFCASIGCNGIADVDINLESFVERVRLRGTLKDFIHLSAFCSKIRRVSCFHLPDLFNSATAERETNW